MGNERSRTMTVEEIRAILDGERPIVVVRCRDCKHSYDTIGVTFCTYGPCVDCIVYDDFFCKNGEKREDE